MFDAYFAVFPWSALAPDAYGLDVGCGSGRWARFVAPKVGRLMCVDASREAIGVARQTLAPHRNVDIRLGAAGALPFGDGTFDFVYALGVLHHTPDPEHALRDCVRVLKPGAPLLVYLYYALDDRPAWYRALWRVADRIRRWVSRRPFAVRRRIADVIAVLVYWPLSRAPRGLERLGRRVDGIPLAFYRDKPLYILRNDALDRFGTPIEHRFPRADIDAMLRRAGVTRIQFSDEPPYWVAVGLKGR